MGEEAQDDWLFRTTYDLRTDFGTSAEGWRELRALRDELKRKGIELVVVYQPTRGLVNREKLSPAEKAGFDYELAKKNYLATIARFRQAGIWTPDFSPLFDEKEEHAYYFKGDHHWTPHGARRSAKIVAETLKQVPGFEEIPKKQFESKRVGLLSKLGTFHKAAAQLCGNSYATQYVDRFETEPVGASDSGDLFGDGGNPQIALVGTSNSGPAYNFAGFLEEFSGADILNNAVSGGGFDSSLLAYMTSEEFHKNPPKILIWEFATHYDMAQKSFYRQAMPLVDNGCSGRKTVLSRKVKLRQGRNEVLLNSAALPIRSGSYVADVTYSDPSVHELKNTIWYMNGRRPYTGSLVFTSKYEGSDSARATLNVKAEKTFRSQIKDITDMERGATKLVTQYMRSGRDGDLACALNWMSAWARAGALQSDDFNHTGKSMRKWALGSLSGAYMRLKFSSSRPIAAHAEQSREIEDWFARLGTQVVRDWSGLPLKKINNHSYWAAWSVMSTAVVTNRRDLFDWAVSEFKVAANQVDEQGFLPNELKRRQRALAYHNYALPPLAMIAAFAQVNGVDLRQENHGALQRLAERVMKGVDDEETFEEKTGEDQDMTDLKVDNKYAWLEPYCALYRCEPKMLEAKKDREPFNSFRLGGEVTRVFSREGGS